MTRSGWRGALDDLGGGLFLLVEDDSFLLALSAGQGHNGDEGQAA